MTSKDNDERIDQAKKLLPFVIASTILLCLADVSGRYIAVAIALSLYFACIYFYIMKTRKNNGIIIFSVIIFICFSAMISPFDFCIIYSNRNLIKTMPVVNGRNASEHRSMIETGKIENRDFVVYAWSRNNPSYALIMQVDIGVPTPSGTASPP